MKKDIVLFSHIPKTAGSSFSNLLIENFGPRVIAGIGRKKGFYDEKDLDNDYKYFPWIRVIRGHEVKLSKLNPDNNKVITFLRDPINRLVSHYVHQYTGKNNEYQMPFEEWLERFNRKDVHFKWISGLSLEDAFEKLSHDNVTIGLLEKFDDSLEIIAQRTLPNLRNPKKIRIKMVARDRSLFNDTKKILEKSPDLVNRHLKIDIEIYNRVVKDLFDKQFGNKKFYIPNTLGSIEQKINRFSYTGFRKLIYNTIK